MLATETIPFVDLRAQHDELRGEIEAAISEIIDRSSFIGGTYVSRFEQEFAEYVGVKEAVAVANGTDALWLGLIAAGVKTGDAVITTPNTFIATVEAITRSGAFPLFVDIDLESALMDIDALAGFLQEKCRREDDGTTRHIATGRRISAVLPVHLYGLPVDMLPLMKLATSYNLVVIEDACQAHGASYQFNGEWKYAGSFGHAAGFSFYPGKNLGAMGDGGAVTTNNSDVAAKIRWFRDHGQSEKYIHITADGWNSRLDSMQAAILSLKLKLLDRWNENRRRAAAQYFEVLADLPLALPVEPENSTHVYHLYVVRSEDRDRLRQELNKRNIQTGLHYPIPLHLQKAYEHLGLGEGSFPNSEQSAATLLSLPMHPMLTNDQIMRVGAACAEILDR